MKISLFILSRLFQANVFENIPHPFLQQGLLQIQTNYQRNTVK
jgi:hypothetical protein